jgi:hypothetical protein
MVLLGGPAGHSLGSSAPCDSVSYNCHIRARDISVNDSKLLMTANICGDAKKGRRQGCDGGQPQTEAAAESSVAIYPRGRAVGIAYIGMT